MNQQLPPQPPPSSELPAQSSSGGSGRAWLFGCGGGCLLLIVVAMGLAIWAVSWFRGIPGRYTDTSPIQIEVEERTPAEIEAAKDKWETFRNAVAKSEPAAPLTLTTEEINTLINSHPDLSEIAGKSRVEIVDDMIGADVSIPIDNFHEMVDGRYLNGRVYLKVNYENENLDLSFESIEVNGNALPGLFMDEFRKELEKQNLMADPEFQKMKNVIESITVKDGVLTVVPKKQAN